MLLGEYFAQNQFDDQTDKRTRFTIRHLSSRNNVRVCVRFTTIDRIRQDDTFSVLGFKSSSSHGVCSKFTAAVQFRAITAAYIKVKSTNNGQYINDLTTLRALISDGIAPLNPDFVIKSSFVAGTLGIGIYSGKSSMHSLQQIAVTNV